MLSFRTDYLKAMREQAPKMFNELRRSGAMDSHLDEKAEEARRLFSHIVEGKPLLQSGVLANLQVEREATEQVYATLMTFPTSDEGKN